MDKTKVITMNNMERRFICVILSLKAPCVQITSEED